MLELIRTGACTTRSDLARHTGLSRSTVSQRVDALVGLGLVLEQGEAKSTGGRPPGRVAFNAGAGVVLAADLGATQARLAVSDRAGSVLIEQAADLDIAAGPDACLSFVLDCFSSLLDRIGRYEARLWRQAAQTIWTLDAMRKPPPPMRQRLRHRAALFAWDRER